MLCNLPQTLPTDVIKLHNAPFTFYLTGSRFFGNITPKSDWDFYASYNKQICEWLNDQGFIQASHHLYGDDPNCVKVFTNTNAATTPIHVQLVADIKAKHQCQTILINVLKHVRDKTVARMFWRVAFAAYAAGRQHNDS